MVFGCQWFGHARCPSVGVRSGYGVYRGDVADTTRQLVGWTRFLGNGKVTITTCYPQVLSTAVDKAVDNTVPVGRLNLVSRPIGYTIGPRRGRLVR